MTRLQARINGKDFKLATAGLTALLLALTLAGAVAPARAAPNSFNNVQVLVKTNLDLQYTYALSAYNESGYLVGSYQTIFPAASFQLPSGHYLITASAMYQVYSPCYLCLTPQAYSASGKADVGLARPGIYKQPSAEYGWVSTDVKGPDTITITTKNVTEMSTSQVSVKVSFANGTAAEGASISASVVGQWYYWWGSDTKVVMWGTTDKNGIATLVLPNAPTEITAWDWVPVNLPQSQTTVQRVVGGETINVTVYWQPTYVGLAASTLWIPQAASVSLTLHYQEPNYWVMPYAAQVGKSTVGGAPATVSDQRGGVPSQVQTSPPQQTSNPNQFYLPSQISALPGVTTITTTAVGSTTAASNSVLLEVGVLAAVALAAASLVVVAIRARK
jgi:hypothetical protein